MLLVRLLKNIVLISFGKKKNALKNSHEHEISDWPNQLN